MSTLPLPNQLTEASALVRLAAEIRARGGGVHVSRTLIRLRTGQEIEALNLLAEHMGIPTNTKNWKYHFDKHIEDTLCYAEPKFGDQDFAEICVKAAIYAANDETVVPSPEALLGPFPEIAASFARLLYVPQYEDGQSMTDKEDVATHLRFDIKAALGRRCKPEYDVNNAIRILETRREQYHAAEDAVNEIFHSINQQTFEEPNHVEFRANQD